MPKKRKRQRQLDMAVAAIRLRYGPQALVKGNPPPAVAAVPHIPTGFPSLDRALGIGGLFLPLLRWRPGWAFSHFPEPPCAD